MAWAIVPTLIRFPISSSFRMVSQVETQELRLQILFPSNHIWRITIACALCDDIILS